MKDWRAVLAEIRAGRGRRGAYNLCKYWRAVAYREHPAAPDPVMRAIAFGKMLENIPLFLYANDEIAGSIRGFYSDAPPPGVSDADYQGLAREHDEKGQRNFRAGFDHTLADYPSLLAGGIDGLLEKVGRSRMDNAESGKIEFLDSARIVLEAFRAFISRYAREARARDLVETAQCLDAVAGPRPRTLRQAMHLAWMTHIAFCAEDRRHMALGRADQYLAPFYERDLRQGLLDRDMALDLFCHLWAHIDEIGHVQNICIGGTTPDGRDATNELSYICLDATKLVKSPHTNLSARFHDKSTDRFHCACFECIRTGMGFPAIFNDHTLVPGLCKLGVPIETARDYCMVGCIETMLPGRQQAWSDSRFNTPLCLVEALDRLRETQYPSFETLETLFRESLASRIRAHAEAINSYKAGYPVERFSDPFLSVLTRDCIARARDINAGGAEFRGFHGICAMGLGTLADSFAAIRKLVFEEKRLTLSRLGEALDADFEGYEDVRLLLLNKAPKYGNNDDYVDSIAARLVEWFAGECLKHEIQGGGRFVICMAANVNNIDAGREVPATPDGRKARTPLSDAASPFFGRDRRGPTAFLGSVAAPDYTNAQGGTVINMRFDPLYFRGERGAGTFRAFTKAFVRRRIPQLQFNFTDDATLLDAQRNPDRHRSLLVRVSGFSAYFVELGPEVQADILRRRAHGVEHMNM